MALKIKERKRARFYAVQALYQKALAHTSINELKLQFYNDNISRHPVEWDFFYRLLDGIDGNQTVIDEKINVYAAKDLDSINLIDLAVLRLGVYELLDCLDVPYQVVINEYIEQAKDLGTDQAHKFVNGLLDKIAKDLRTTESN